MKVLIGVFIVIGVLNIDSIIRLLSFIAVSGSGSLRGLFYRERIRMNTSPNADVFGAIELNDGMYDPIAGYAKFKNREDLLVFCLWLREYQAGNPKWFDGLFPRM